VWPGEFVFGYASQADEGAAPGPIADGGAPWMHNGSFVILRRYRQDVDGLGRFLRATAAELARAHPELRGLTAERLGAMMVGRWKSGAPLALAPERDAAALGGDGGRNNEFDFAAAALPCPHAAHIRRANPRGDRAAGGPAVVA